MRTTRRRPMHYTGLALLDGTIVAAYPIRKPASPRRKTRQRVDPDGVAIEYASGGKELSQIANENPWCPKTQPPRFAQGRCRIAFTRLPGSSA